MTSTPSRQQSTRPWPDPDVSAVEMDPPTPSTSYSEGTLDSSAGTLVNYKQTERFKIPTYSDNIQGLLDKGEIYKDWSKFIEETAFHAIAHYPMQDRGEYADFGRFMYSKFPCIKHKGAEPWVSKSCANATVQLHCMEF